MTLQEVKALAAKGEGLTIEFKKKAAFPEKIVREVIALANTEGGDLLIGVDDDGTVCGQRFIEEEVFVMEKAIRELILPSGSSGIPDPPRAALESTRQRRRRPRGWMWGSSGCRWI